jgi:outer membrane protein OmpA-like peptidoglycan-associated protein
VINSPDNEESPFVHFDGQTLYFMRDGKQGLGGYDLYMSRRAIDGNWQQPENLGVPINSGSDEGALSIHPDGKRAIITRETPEQKTDLFEFVLPERFRAASLQALHVTIKDLKTKQPLRARVEVFEVDKQDTIRLSQWSDQEGKLSIALQRNKNYGLMVVQEGYILYSAGLESDTSASRVLDIWLIPFDTEGEKLIVLQNIFFQFGSAALLPSSEPELNKLLWTLRNHPEMKLEIRGHTDHIGEEAANQLLSEARAKSVLNYLVSRGIDPSRLTSKGFGETQPVADNDTAEGQRKNRRTEFRIISL